MDWQSTLYNGLIQPRGKPVKVDTANITKSRTDKQLSERMLPSLEVVTDNSRNRGLLNPSKQRFSAHRAISFLPQD